MPARSAKISSRGGMPVPTRQTNRTYTRQREQVTVDPADLPVMISRADNVGWILPKTILTHPRQLPFAMKVCGAQRSRLTFWHNLARELTQDGSAFVPLTTRQLAAAGVAAKGTHVIHRAKPLRHPHIRLTHSLSTLMIRAGINTRQRFLPVILLRDPTVLTPPGEPPAGYFLCRISQVRDKRTHDHMAKWMFGPIACEMQTPDGPLEWNLLQPARTANHLIHKVLGRSLHHVDADPLLNLLLLPVLDTFTLTLGQGLWDGGSREVIAHPALYSNPVPWPTRPHNAKTGPKPFQERDTGYRLGLLPRWADGLHKPHTQPILDALKNFDVARTADFQRDASFAMFEGNLKHHCVDYRWLLQILKRIGLGPVADLTVRIQRAEFSKAERVLRARREKATTGRERSALKLQADALAWYQGYQKPYRFPKGRYPLRPWFR